MSLLTILATVASGLGGVILTLSGGSAQDIDSGASATAGFRFNTDGTVDRLQGSSYTQISAATDWIIPNQAADSTYDVRITNIGVGDPFTDLAAAEDVWIDLGTNREYKLVNSGGDLKSNTCDFEIRNDAGTTVASTAGGSYDVEADNSP
jgi:hypothetical protein